MQEFFPSESRVSSVPTHLLRFHHSCPSKDTTGHCYNPTTSTINPREYIYLPLPDRNWRELLKDIIVKDWNGSSRNAELRRPAHRRRLITMHNHQQQQQRMKFSDDYITARAANPRTGLISPSASASTPSTPGEALARLIDPNAPPAQHIVPRPALRRANQGRKVSAESVRTWHPDDRGWLVDAGARAAASPHLARIKANAFAPPDARLQGDHFVVNMPSGREPRPYEHPQYWASRIDVYEPYRQRPRVTSDNLHTRRRQDTSQVAMPYHNDPRALRRDNLHVTKRRTGLDRIVDISDGFSPEINAVSFAPFTSPKTPTAGGAEDPSMAMSDLPRDIHRRQQIPRKPVGSANHRTASETASKAPPVKEDYSANTVPGMEDLPRMRLAHPSVAGLPRHEHHPYTKAAADEEMERERAFSLSHYTTIPGPALVQRRTASAQSDTTTPFGPPLSLNQDHSNHERSSSPPPSFPDILASLLLSLLSTLRTLPTPRLPRIPLLETLSSDHASAADKVRALKRLLATLGRVVVVLALAAMGWQLGCAVVYFAQVLAWPLIAPWKMLRWILGVG